MRFRIENIKRSLGFSIAVMMLLSCMVIVPNETRAATSGGGTVSIRDSVSPTPSEPLNLEADAGNGFIWLWWDHPTSQGSFLIKNYTIYRSMTSNEGDFVLLATELIGVNHYNDTLDINNDGTTFYYMIKANNDAGSSAYSNMASATPVASDTPPGAVQDLVATNQIYSVQLDWTSPASNGSNPVRYYFVYREYQDVTTLIDVFSEATFSHYDDEYPEILPGHVVNYTVRAISSSWGSADAVTTVHIGGTGNIPGAPENLTATGQNNSVSLYWDNPANPSESGISKYKVQRSSSETGTFTTIGNISSPIAYYAYFDDDTAVNGATYYYRVISSNSNGDGLPSGVVNATPAEYSWPLAPLSIDAYPGDNQILLEWGSVHNATGYQIFRSETEGVYGSTAYATVALTPRFWYDNSTANGVKQYYSVKAVFGSSVGPFSLEANATAHAGEKPTAPTNLIATPYWVGVMLYATLAESTDIFVGYSIYRGDSTGNEGLIPIDNVSSIGFHGMIYDIDITMDDVNHYYYVTVWNLYGESAPSNEAMSFASISGDEPDPVTTLAATGGTGQVTLTWSDPAYQGTANLLTYKIERYNGTAWNLINYMMAGLGQQTYVDSHRDAGTTYYYRVLASNNYNQGSQMAISNTVSALTTGTNAAPSAPRNLAYSSGTGYVQLSWDVPTTIGNGITEYQILRGASSSGEISIGTVTGSTLSYNDTTVGAGSTYYYVVKAVNSVGPSVSSNEVSVTMPTETAPSKPLNLTAFATAGQIQLNWSAPSSVGNGLTEYRIYKGTTAGGEGTAPIALVSSTILTYIDTQIDAGTTYYYVVKAVNAAGLGSASNEVTALAVTVPGAPSEPLGLTAVIGSGYILLNWTAPTTLGSGITNYSIYKGTTAGGAATLIEDVSGLTLTYNDTAVALGVPYYYVVKAKNAAGTSNPSVEVKATIPNPALPTAPKNVTVKQGVGNVMVTWEAPDSTGSSPITGYMIYRSMNGSQLAWIANTTATARSYTDSSVDTAHNYLYSIVAVNANGNGISSPETSSIIPGTAAKTDDTMLFAGIGIAAIVIVVILAALLVFRRKK